jgi:hypothetical protein
MVTEDVLRRDATTSLWRYLPEQPFAAGGGAVVKGEQPQVVGDLDIDERFVRPALLRLIRPFAEARSGIPGAGTDVEVIENGQYRLVEPMELRGSRFPNTFRCGNCGWFTNADLPLSAPNCRRCKRSTEQFAWVIVHTCGMLRPLTPPQCINNCKGGMALRNTHRFSTFDWRWVCLVCSTRSDAPVGPYVCRDCNRKGPRVVRANQAIAYRPMSLTLLNPLSRSDYAHLTAEHAFAAGVASCLGVLPSGLEGLKAASTDETADETKIREAAKLLGYGDDSPELGKMLADLAGKSSPRTSWRDVVEGLGLADGALEPLGEECLQLSLARDAGALSIRELTTMSVGTALAARHATYPALLIRYGLAEVTLLRKLPLAFLVPGFTRLGSTADGQTRFNYFPDTRKSRYEIYGQKVSTEGLLFRFDPDRVVRWLVTSGVVDDPGLLDAQRWLMRVSVPVADLFNPTGHRITDAVLGLVHSASHRAMKALGVASGLHTDSLAEYIFPANAAFLIYANSRSEFVLGGLEHVFRYALDEVLTDLDAERRCVFDPLCRHAPGGAACAACLHVSEVACSRFNTVLDRNLLWGTVPLAHGAGTPTADSAPDGPGALVEPLWQPFWPR